MEFLVDLWSSIFDGDKPTPRNVQRTIKAATQPHGDAAPRVNAAHQLASWGTPEALAGLLRRFTVQTSSGAVDLDEKQEVRELLVEAGQAAVKPILEYLETGQDASYPAQALERILPEAELIEQVLATLGRLEGTHSRTPKGKLALIAILSSHDDSRIPEAVKPFLLDPDDDVAFASVECLAKAGYEQGAREGFLELCVEAQDRPRIRSHVLEAMAELGWPVTGFRRRLETSLPEGFTLTSKGLIKTHGSLA